MKKFIATIVAAAMIAGGSLSFAPNANAAEGKIAAGVASSILGGILLRGAIANGGPVYAAPPTPSVYYQPAQVYVEEPACRLVSERYWDGYAYRVRWSMSATDTVSLSRALK